MRNVVLYIALSLDGFIAGPDDDLSFLQIVERAGEDYGYAAFMSTVDTVVLGRKTYDKVLSFGIGFPHADRECYVLTRSPRPSEGSVHFVNQDPTSLIAELRVQDGQSIFIDGGAEIVQQLLRSNSIDTMVLSYIPCMLGSGTRLFGNDSSVHRFNLQSVKTFDSSLIQVEYTIAEAEEPEVLGGEPRST